jgi:hypothetical protein
MHLPETAWTLRQCAGEAVDTEVCRRLRYRPVTERLAASPVKIGLQARRYAT